MTLKRSRTLKDIDPETARGLLANSISNEPADEARIHEMAIQMKKGRFDTYGVSIEIDEKGHLTGGLPYLKSILESGSTVRIWVIQYSLQ